MSESSPPPQQHWQPQPWNAPQPDPNAPNPHAQAAQGAQGAQGAWTPQPVPGAIPPPALEDYDLASLSPFWPKVGAALTALAGLCAVLGSFQTWMTVDVVTVMFVLPIVDFLLGIAAIGVATRLVAARRWAAIVALALTGLLALGTSVWMVYAVMNGFVAAFVLLAPVMSFAGVGLCVASLGPCERADVARDRLASQGMELGF